jgi:hypothetical protein
MPSSCKRFPQSEQRWRSHFSKRLLQTPGLPNVEYIDPEVSQIFPVGTAEAVALNAIAEYLRELMKRLETCNQGINGLYVYLLEPAKGRESGRIYVLAKSPSLDMVFDKIDKVADFVPNQAQLRAEVIALRDLKTKQDSEILRLAVRHCTSHTANESMNLLNHPQHFPTCSSGHCRNLVVDSFANGSQKRTCATCRGHQKVFAESDKQKKRKRCE